MSVPFHQRQAVHTQTGPVTYDLMALQSATPRTLGSCTIVDCARAARPWHVGSASASAVDPRARSFSCWI